MSLKIFLPSNLKFLRNQRDLTTAQVADFLGKTDSAVSQWENGLYRPKFEFLVKLREMYNVDMESLIFTDLTNPGNSSVDSGSKEDQTATAISISNNTDHKLLVELKKILDRLDDLDDRVKQIEGE